MKKAINVITKLYNGDITKVKLNEDEEIRIPVSSGIRQGCTDSTTLFKLVTYKIKQEFEVLDKKYKDENFCIISLFFADDGMLLANSTENAEKVIEQITKTGRDYELEIDKQKSNNYI